MRRAKVQAFIKRLQLAKAAIARGDSGCAMGADRCWRCAMTKRTGPGLFYGYTGPDADWSLGRPQSDTLAMFDNSIAALSELTQKGQAEK